MRDISKCAYPGGKKLEILFFSFSFGFSFRGEGGRG